MIKGAIMAPGFDGSVSWVLLKPSDDTVLTSEWLLAALFVLQSGKRRQNANAELCS